MILQNNWYIRIYISNVKNVSIDCVSDIGLYFIRSPEPIVAPPGDEVIFECSLNVPSELVRWKHGSEFLPREHTSSVSNRPLTTSHRLVKVVDEHQAGDYQVLTICVLFNV